MNQTFDFFGYPEYPYILLANPDKTELYSLGLAFNTELVKRFNGLSEFKFKFPQSIDGGETTIEAYDYIQNKRLVKIENYGYFIITDSVENSEGAVPIKEVSCQSLESELIQKKITAYGGTKPLWLLTPQPTSTGLTSVLYDILQLAPNWSLGDIDVPLLVKYRTFNVTDSNIYNFLMNDVCKAFECVFIFDTDARTISAKAIDTSTTTSDIFMSFDNIIKNSSFSEKSEEIVTCLAVYGGGTLNIRAVNPLGTDKVYDFSYYKTTQWMSQGLVDAISLWESHIADFLNGTDINGHNPSLLKYADLLSTLRGYNLELIIFQSGLLTLQGEYSALETEKKTLIQSGGSLSDVNSRIALKQTSINSQNVSIANKQSQISFVMADITEINSLVSFNSNFTPVQLLELDNFIYQNTYKNDNIIQTDIMTDVEIQDAEQELYDQGLNILSRVSQPRYEISVESVNFVSLPEFSSFTSQAELGTTVTCEISPEVFITAVLLEVTMTFDNPESFSILLSNRIRKDGSGFVFSDLYGQVAKTGSSVAFDSYKWSNWEDGYKNDVTSFITSSLNASTNSLISNSNQEILIDSNGLRGRSIIPGTTTYSDNQVWLTNNVLAFSSDGFATSRLALGSISTTAGVKYGLVAEVIYGNLLAGNTLTISNTRVDGQPSNFTLNETGATLTNASMTLTGANTKLIMNPLDIESKIFRIQKRNPDTSYSDVFYADSAGNLHITGDITATSGSFTGTINATSGTFTGAVHATTLTGNLDWNNLTNIPAEKITSGQMSSARLGGGYSASSLGAGVGNPISGILSVPSGLQVNGGDIVLNGGRMFMTTAGYISFAGSVLYPGSYGVSTGGYAEGDTLTTRGWVRGNRYGYGDAVYFANVNTPQYYAGGTAGITASFSVVTTLGNKVLTIKNGIVTRFS